MHRLAPLALLLLVACASETEEAPPPIASSPEALSSISCAEHTETGYRNGVAFAITVVTVDGLPVEHETADAYYVMAEAASRAGVQLHVVSGFRTMAEQEHLYYCYTSCSCNSCNLAARPGYSNHQSGHALDLNTSSTGVYAWLEAHGASFGFNRTVPSEAWHWEWWGGGPGGGPCVPPPPPPPPPPHDAGHAVVDAGHDAGHHDAGHDAGGDAGHAVIVHPDAGVGDASPLLGDAARITMTPPMHSGGCSATHARTNGALGALLVAIALVLRRRACRSVSAGRGGATSSHPR
jgi:hypothetical protein